MHIQQAPRRREAVECSGRRTAGVVRGGEQGPGHGGGVERMQVVKILCRQGDRGRGEGGVINLSGADPSYIGLFTARYAKRSQAPRQAQGHTKN